MLYEIKYEIVPIIISYQCGIRSGGDVFSKMDSCWSFGGDGIGFAVTGPPVAGNNGDATSGILARFNWLLASMVAMEQRVSNQATGSITPDKRHSNGHCFSCIETGFSNPGGHGLISHSATNSLDMMSFHHVML